MSKKLNELYRLYNSTTDEWLSFETSEQVKFYMLNKDCKLVHYMSDFYPGEYENYLVQYYYVK